MPGLATALGGSSSTASSFGQLQAAASPLEQRLDSDLSRLGSREGSLRAAVQVALLLRKQEAHFPVASLLAEIIAIRCLQKRTLRLSTYFQARPRMVVELLQVLAYQQEPHRGFTEALAAALPELLPQWSDADLVDFLEAYAEVCAADRVAANGRCMYRLSQLGPMVTDEELMRRLRAIAATAAAGGGPAPGGAEVLGRLAWSYSQLTLAACSAFHPQVARLKDPLLQALRDLFLAHLDPRRLSPSLLARLLASLAALSGHAPRELQLAVQRLAHEAVVRAGDFEKHDWAKLMAADATRKLGDDFMARLRGKAEEASRDAAALASAPP